MCIRDRQIRHLRIHRRRTHPSGTLGANIEAVSGPAQFKLRTPLAIAHFRRSKSSGELQGAPRSSPLLCGSGAREREDRPAPNVFRQ
eukprot:14739220-Alexandrium_andersonii.AAC.1